ncbi:MAG TPA: hypothetical protein VF120_16130 [Ktedonobacterales bacterium]
MIALTMIALTMIALRLRQSTVPLVAGGLALGAFAAVVATTSLHASPDGIAFALALLLAALVGIAKTTTA